MPKPRAPGNYVEEVSTMNTSITAAPTSAAVFLGGAEQGPVGSPVVVRTMSEFTTTFGASSGPLATAVELFFLNGGTDAVLLRVSKGDATSSARTVSTEVSSSSRQAPSEKKVPASQASVKAGPAAQLDASCFTAEKGGIRALDSVAFNLMYIPP